MNSEIEIQRDIFKLLYEELQTKYAELKVKHTKREFEIMSLSVRVNDIEKFLNDEYKNQPTLDSYIQHIEYINEKLTHE